jgi:hypothetical protein
LIERAAAGELPGTDDWVDSGDLSCTKIRGE